MKITYVTLFPSLIEPYFQDSILFRAREKELFKTEFVDPRDFSNNKHKKVDDYQAGGGAGLVMKADVLDAALNSVYKKDKNAYFIFVVPSGKPFNQKDALRLSKKEHIVFVSGRYEGIDERVIEKWADELFSIGDFILTGGELPSMCMSDAILRNIDGVLGNSDSLNGESFENDLLEAPTFTKPNIFEKNSLIKEYLKGNHSKIHDLKVKLATAKTKYFRPDLYKRVKIKLRNTDEK
ncbi:MAG: tRNA (guanosine(37)-N1)-methyltransferase TrmD [Sulfurospirillum sp.]|nr:MAG: tRNA (guanosine(37)-N1)-methyltransferase TrmD [Sulfurospirillum sp.]